MAQNLASPERGEVLPSVEADGTAQLARQGFDLATSAQARADQAFDQGVLAEQRADTAISDAAAATSLAQLALSTAATEEKVSTEGDTMTGFLTLHDDPVIDFHAATKSYVDSATTAATANFLPASDVYTRAHIDQTFLTKAAPTVTGGPLTLAQDAEESMHAVTLRQSNQALDEAIDTHTQPISRVTGLQAALDALAPLFHTHDVSEVSGLGNIVGRNITVSPSPPSGGEVGDLWLELE